MNTQINLLQRISIILLLVLAFLLQAMGTNQVPDKMTYGEIKMGLETSWAFPSPLQLYFYQNNISYPFQGLSTANYRGFIADWEIKDKKLFLRKIKVEEKEFTPEHYKIHSTNKDYHNNAEVFADWFSGIIECSFRKKGDFNHITSYFFLIREGVIIEEDHVSGRLGNNDYFSKLKEVKLYKMMDSYMAFYYQLSDDMATLNGASCRLNKSYSQPSLLLGHYGKSLLDFPYNWENLEKSGHPIAKWEIENEVLYLTNYNLAYGNRLDTIYKHYINLDEEFKENVKDGKVKAYWVNGVQLLKFGQTETKTYPSGYETKRFKISHFIFIRIKDGELIEQHKVDGGFDFDDMPKETDPRIKKIIQDYFE